jgi:hypothetical protein
MPPLADRAGDNQWVRRLLAAVMLALFASLSAIDGVCCPDGCRHEQPSPSQSDSHDGADGICVLCLGGVDSSVRQDLSHCDVVTDSIRLPPLVRHLDAPADTIEHPPRS